MINVERIIVALDCPADEARSLASRLAGKARWLKVGMTLYYAASPSIVREFKERGFKVFVDLKLHDIPHQVRGAASSVVAAGADMLTVHGAGGLAMLRAAAKGSEQAWQARGDTSERPKVIAVTVLTSMDRASLAQVGVERSINEQVTLLARLAQEARLDGVVASPQEARALRTLLGPNAAIVTPGVRPQGASQDDQSRTATPAEALENGASHLVIGRPITAAPNPASAFDAIMNEIESNGTNPR
ncbi:MAG: orotidine-5'-phosphate decarboxylase [Coriobacteriales bacterium]|nr:orotidine-5'-phosphate decarboxylase [Coriobacteriales bacterium]